jgi:hypothetical protein
VINPSSINPSSTPTNTPSEEFEQLLTGVLDGSPDAPHNKRLCELLRLYPALQNDYLELTQLHALLIWREGRVIPQTCRNDSQNMGVVEASEVVESASTQPAIQSPPQKRKRWAKAAALACVAAGIAFVLNLISTVPPERENGPEVVEQLVGWNLDIARAEGHDDRQIIYDAKADGMKVLLTNAKLSFEDRDLAQSLVDNGAWLTNNDDPTAEAERFGEIADKLLIRLDSATLANDNKGVIKFASTYQRVNELGVAANLDRAIKAPHDPKRKTKIDRLIAGDDGRARKLEDLLDRHPDSSWKAINRALKGHRRKYNVGTKQGN